MEMNVFELNFAFDDGRQKSYLSSTFKTVSTNPRRFIVQKVRVVKAFARALDEDVSVLYLILK